jgi:2-polyprenyl-3-methyl-5-hydroxy-6-metoxy-1,4-benzoquinol methylase
MSHQHKRRLPDFLGLNPFPHPYTQGLFYREKMRAIHRIAPDLPMEKILEVGGGRSGLTSMLYPNAEVLNIDLNGEYASDPCNQRPGVRFVCGNATDLPFEDESFDAVTMFDLLEHVQMTAERRGKHFASCALAVFCWSARQMKTGGFRIICS